MTNRHSLFQRVGFQKTDFQRTCFHFAFILYCTLPVFLHSHIVIKERKMEFDSEMICARERSLAKDANYYLNSDEIDVTEWDLKVLW